MWSNHRQIMRLDSHYYCVCEVGLQGRYLIHNWNIYDADTDPHLVENAVRYIIFLVDADSLFDTALGMYDFSLVLLIAQHAQKVGLLCFPLKVTDVPIGSQRIPTFPSGPQGIGKILSTIQD